MKEAYKFLDQEAFDDEEEALNTVSVSDAQWAVKLGIIEELQKVIDKLEAFEDLACAAIARGLKDRIKLLQSNKHKLNEAL